MSNPIRFILPFGLVRFAQLFGQLRQMGIGRRRAFVAAADPSTNQRLQRSRLHLLPPASLSRLPCVVDAGANIGDWTRDLLRFVTPDQALVVEPDPRLAPTLQERFKAFPQVQLHHVALGAEEGTLPFHQMGQSDMNSMLEPTAASRHIYGHTTDIRNTVEVPVKTLDALTDNIPKISLLKLDVQGFEQHVLRGAVDMLRRTDAVLLEINFVSHYQGDLCFQDLDRVMNDHGFALSNYSQPARMEHFAMWADGLYLRRKAVESVRE